MTARIPDNVVERIRELQAQGLGTGAIGERLSLSLGVVTKYKKILGLPVWPPLPEKQILKLLRKGLAPMAIAKCLKVSYRRTRTFAHHNGFGKPRKELSAAQLQALVADITNRCASAMALAKKHKCSYKTALSLAHKLLACERFLPSWRTPLSSYLPAKYFDAEIGR